MDRRITVLQVIPRMRAGGAELGCQQVAAALVKSGHRALVASEGGRMVSALADNGAQHIELPLASKSPWRIWRNAQALEDLIRRERVDIIHARSRAPAWSALIAARRTGVAFVTTYHSEYSESGRLKKLYNSVMARSDKVIAVSDHMAGLIRDRYDLAPARIATIHRAFDQERFDPAVVTPERLAAARALLGLAPGERMVLLAGRITRRKAQAHLIEAMGLLRQRGIDDVTCVFAGEIEKPDYKAKLDAAAARLGIAHRLRFPGNVADMPATFLLADVSLNISEAEGLPRVALESQAMGTPVIVSDTGPGREVALTSPDTPHAAVTGLRVPYADPPALADALADFLSRPPAERAAMGARAAAHVRSRYTLERMTGATLGVYAEVVKAKGANLPAQDG